MPIGASPEFPLRFLDLADETLRFRVWIPSLRIARGRLTWRAQGEMRSV